MTVNRFRIFKRFIKIMIAIIILLLSVFLIFVVKDSKTFENSNMTKWLKISDVQRVATLERVVKNTENQDLIIACVNKIAGLPNSNEMIIRDAISLCYNGIKLNQNNNQDEHNNE